jgi:hypothetical protein
MVKRKEKITLFINHCWVEIIGANISNTLFFLHRATILLWNFLSCVQGQFNEFKPHEPFFELLQYKSLSFTYLNGKTKLF